MPNVQMPNGDIVAFPDDMPREQIKSMIATKFPDMVPKPAPKVDMFDTVADNALQGATFGLGNRASAGLAALVQSGINGGSIEDNYKKAREVGSQRLAAEMQQNPATAIASNLAGGLATGGLAAGTKAGAAIGNSLRTGGTAARIGKGALAGAASGAAYGAGTAEYDKSLEGAGQGALYGGLVGGAIPGVGALASSAYKGSKNALTGAFARTTDQLDEALAARKDVSSQAYQAMRDAGAVINKPRAVNIANRVEAAVKSGGALNPRLHSTTIGLMEDFKEAARAGEMSLDDLDKWRQTFGQVAGNFNDKLNQRNASIAISAIDDAVDNLKGIDLRGGNTAAIDALHMGRKEWATARKFERISDIVRKSEGDANYLKREFKKVLNNPKLHRGFSNEELDALRKASQLTAGEGMLKMLGKFGIDFGGPSRIGNTALPVISTVLGQPGLAVAGTGARQTQKYIARGKAENLLKTIEGTANASTSSPVSSFLSAPAGGVAGAISNQETRQPVRMTITPQDKLPEPVVNLPQIGPQTNVRPELFERVIHTESRGNQAAVSPKGAIGVAQIMPNTAPDAAKAAGLPYDFNKLKTDPEYNAALGKAYLGKMLDKYGNETHALIAYNWGPGNTDRWLKRGGNIDLLPKETRNYIRKILNA
jgi:hypothetical protein